MFSRDWLPIAASQIVAVVCGLAGVHLTTRWVRPEEAGTYGLFLSLTPLGAMLTHAGLIKHFSRHWVGAPDRRSYLRVWLRASLWASAVLLAGVLLAGAARLIQPRTGWAVAALFIATSAGAYAQSFQLGVQSAARYWTDFGLTFFGSTTRTFVPLLAIWGTGAGVAALAGGYALHAVGFAGLAGVVVLRLSRNPVSGSAAGEQPASLRAYQMVFLFHGALVLVNQGVVRWSASFAFDDATLGYITLAANLAAVGPSLASGALWQFSYPRLLAQKRDAGMGPMQRLADLTLALYVLACLGGGLLLAGLLPLLPGTLVANAYLPALRFVLPLFSFYAGLCGLTLLQGELLVLDRPRAALRFAALGTALLAGGTLAFALLSPARLIAWWWYSFAAALLPLWIALRRGWWIDREERT
ncbi:MAG: hypothetical protein HYV95_04050 [Opitutae bacterium]|nr:hypothetical protein [Opitutae bacterium]